MKVGILTFHCAHNYGAVLQCYALQEYLRSVGHDVYVIDYRPDYLTNYYKIHKKEYWTQGTNRFRAIIRECVRLPFRICRYKVFQGFINSRFRLCPYQLNGNLNDFDAVIYGSDQIWNANITGKAFDPVFFGNDVYCKKIAYAASNKSISLTQEEKEYYTRALSEFDYIGVREITLQRLLQPLTQKTIHLNLDPTLLSDNFLFENLSSLYRFRHKYVFIYEISPHDEVYRMAKEYALNCNWRVVELAATVYANRMCERNQTASPEKWVSYIKHAELIVTTSFHGVAFSIMFKKQFYYVRQHNPSDYRIESLLNQLNLNVRIIEKNEQIIDSPIDYFSVHDRLSLLRKDSIKFLKNALA